MRSKVQFMRLYVNSYVRTNSRNKVFDELRTCGRRNPVSSSRGHFFGEIWGELNGFCCSSVVERQNLEIHGVSKMAEAKQAWAVSRGGRRQRLGVYHVEDEYSTESQYIYSPFLLHPATCSPRCLVAKKHILSQSLLSSASRFDQSPVYRLWDIASHPNFSSTSKL